MLQENNDINKDENTKRKKLISFSIFATKRGVEQN